MSKTKEPTPPPSKDAMLKVLEEVMKAQEMKPDELKAKQLRLLEALLRAKK